MKVTEGKFKDRQLQREGQLQKVTAEQREYAEASACRRIAESTDIITDFPGREPPCSIQEPTAMAKSSTP